MQVAFLWMPVQRMKNEQHSVQALHKGGAYHGEGSKEQKLSDQWMLKGNTTSAPEVRQR